MKKLKSLILTGLITCLCSGVFAQVKYYKIQNGTKTLLKEGEELNIKLNEKMEPEVNFLMEVDIVAFRKAQTYQLIAATMVYVIEGKSYIKYLHDWNLESEMFKAKYGTEKVLNFYLFGTPDVIKNPKNMSFYKTNIPLSDAEDSYHFDLEAAYKTGKEGYFDNNVYKERDVFSKREYVPNPKSPIVSFSIPESVTLKHKYDVLVSSGNGIYEGINSLGLINDDLRTEVLAVKNIKANVPVLGYVPTFPEVARAMEAIMDYKRNEIKNEADMTKAIALVEAWNKDAAYLHVLEKSETSTLKAFNKKLKGITDPIALMELFKNYTGK